MSIWQGDQFLLIQISLSLGIYSFLQKNEKIKATFENVKFNRHHYNLEDTNHSILHLVIKLMETNQKTIVKY